MQTRTYATPTVEEFEKIVQRTEQNKLLTYLNSSKNVLGHNAH